MKAIDIAFYDKLTGSTALTALVGGTASPRIYNTIAPQDADLPLVVFQKQGGGHVPDTPRENVEVIYMCKAVGGNILDCEEVEVEITNAIDRKDLTVTNGYADYGCFKRGHLHFAEDLGGGSILFHIGGLYDVMVSSTA